MTLFWLYVIDPRGSLTARVRNLRVVIVAACCEEHAIANVEHCFPAGRLSQVRPVPLDDEDGSLARLPDDDLAALVTLPRERALTMDEVKAHGFSRMPIFPEDLTPRKRRR